jgi:outer membrane protein OmpA-like peptidoglycan-associated protein
MRGISGIALTVFSAVLMLWLILGFWTMTAVAASALCLLVLLAAGMMVWRQYHQTHDEAKVADDRLPAEDFRGAVVLVCGDSAPLFMQGGMRETPLGWYLPVSKPEQLTGLMKTIADQRPALLPQVSVLMAVVPEQHASAELFTSHYHGWQRAVSQCCRGQRVPPPFWIVYWLSHPMEGTEWFSLISGQDALQVYVSASESIPLAEWFREKPARLTEMLWLDGMLMWQAQYIEPLSQLKPCRVGLCLTPVSVVPNNLWAQHLAGLTTLPYSPELSDATLPLPDAFLYGLARRRGISGVMRYSRVLGLIFAAFLALALLASFLNNQRLIRITGDHLSLWAHLSVEPVEPKARAREQLIADRKQLDGWQRGGEPLRLGLGLYQGMRLFAPVDAAVNSWAPPPPPVPPAPIIRKIVQGPKTVRLDSLSLFDSGRAELKSGSSKVLINALVGIKAKPGWLIVVSGHTDSTGSVQTNQLLSQRRAEAVRNWMRDTGDVDESCFAVQGFGQSRPIESNETAKGRALNRRVEISLVPQADACQAPDAISPSSQDGDGNHEEKE